jgi:glycosyltransferase involved in cell wall biosynthesis
VRVAIVAESYLPYVSGVTVSTETLARGLGARGHEVLLVAPRPARGESPGTQGVTGPEPRYAWLPSYQLPVRAPRGYRMPIPLPGRAIERAVRFGPQIVHVQAPFVAGWLGHRIARRSGARLVFTHHTRFSQYRHYLGPAGRPADLLVRRYLRRFWSACDAVVAPAADLAQEIEAGMRRASRTLVRVIPTGIDVAAIRATPPLDPRPGAGWPAETVVATILGRLAQEKSVDVVIDAVALAARSVPSLRLSIVGDGPARRELEERARALLGERAWFAGARPRPEALALVRGADLFCFASRTETQGLVLAEALACGLPTVALEGPGVRDSVRDAIDGIVVERGADPAAALARATALLAGDVPRRRALAAEAAAGAARFDVAARLAEVEALYRELVVAG